MSWKAALTCSRLWCEFSVALSSTSSLLFPVLQARRFLYFSFAPSLAFAFNLARNNIAPRRKGRHSGKRERSKGTLRRPSVLLSFVCEVISEVVEETAINHSSLKHLPFESFAALPDFHDYATPSPIRLSKANSLAMHNAQSRSQTHCSAVIEFPRLGSRPSSVIVVAVEERKGPTNENAWLMF
jgi:hypothetical protein